MIPSSDKPAGIYLVGASGHGKVAAGIARDQQIHVVGFFDDNPACIDPCAGHPVLGRILELGKQPKLPIFAAIGNNQVRYKVIKRICEELKLDRFLTLIHSRGFLAPTSQIGFGSMLATGAIISEECKIGDHCIINTRASVDHECSLGNFVHIACGATLAGNVQAGEGAFVGAGATILPGVRIGAWAVVGAGATVTRDVADGETVVGTPAKPMR